MAFWLWLTILQAYQHAGLALPQVHHPHKIRLWHPRCHNKPFAHWVMSSRDAFSEQTLALPTIVWGIFEDVWSLYLFFHVSDRFVCHGRGATDCWQGIFLVSFNVNILRDGLDFVVTDYHLTFCYKTMLSALSAISLVSLHSVKINVLRDCWALFVMCYNLKVLFLWIPCIWIHTSTWPWNIAWHRKWQVFPGFVKGHSPILT